MVDVSKKLGLPTVVVPIASRLADVPEWAIPVNPYFGFAEVKRKDPGAQPVRFIQFRRNVNILIFGLDPAASHIFVGHPSVSPQHAFVGFHANTQRCVLKDLESANGTFIDNKPVDHSRVEELAPGNRVRFGDSAHEFVFDRLPPDLVKELPPLPSAPVPSGDAHTEASAPPASAIAPFPRDARPRNLSPGAAHSTETFVGHRPPPPDRNPPPRPPFDMPPPPREPRRSFEDGMVRDGSPHAPPPYRGRPLPPLPMDDRGRHMDDRGRPLPVDGPDLPMPPPGDRSSRSYEPRGGRHYDGPPRSHSPFGRSPRGRGGPPSPLHGRFSPARLGDPMSPHRRGIRRSDFDAPIDEGQGFDQRGRRPRQDFNERRLSPGRGRFEGGNFPPNRHPDDFHDNQDRAQNFSEHGSPHRNRGRGFSRDDEFDHESHDRYHHGHGGGGDGPNRGRSPRGRNNWHRGGGGRDYRDEEENDEHYRGRGGFHNRGRGHHDRDSF